MSLCATHGCSWKYCLCAMVFHFVYKNNLTRVHFDVLCNRENLEIQEEKEPWASLAPEACRFVFHRYVSLWDKSIALTILSFSGYQVRLSEQGFKDTILMQPDNFLEIEMLSSFWMSTLANFCKVVSSQVPNIAARSSWSQRIRWMEFALASLETFLGSSPTPHHENPVIRNPAHTPPSSGHLTKAFCKGPWVASDRHSEGLIFIWQSESGLVLRD